MNRRDLLKMFGIGTVIAPVVNGLPLTTSAVIVETPTIEVPRPEILSPRPFDAFSNFTNQRNLDIVVYAKPKASSKWRRLDCTQLDAYVTEFSVKYPTGSVIEQQITLHMGGPMPAPNHADRIKWE